MPIDPEAALEKIKSFNKGHPSLDERQAFVKRHFDVRPTEGEYFDKIGRRFREMNVLRKALFLRLLSGKLGSALGRALEGATVRPYQSGYSRQPFRAPNLPTLTDSNRGKLIIAAWQLERQYNLAPAALAEWCGYIDPDGFFLHLENFLAAAIDEGDKEVLNILIQTIRGEHPIGAISRTGVRALLASSNPEAWAEVERLLLLAQRQEGLRQTIFESVDELRPEAFKRFLGAIIEHNLLRFSSVARAFITWLPDLWAEDDAKNGTRILGRLLEFLNDPAIAPNDDDATDVYLRLWSLAFLDIEPAQAAAAKYLSNPHGPTRRAAARLVASLAVTTTLPMMRKVVLDPDRTVASVAIESMNRFSTEQLVQQELTANLQKAAADWPKGKQPMMVERSDVWNLLLRATPIERTVAMAPHAKEFSPAGRQLLAERLSHIRDVRVRRDLALELFGDTSPAVRSTALAAFEVEPLLTQEAVVIEDLLRRKASGLRSSAIKLLSKQPEPAILATSDRLIASKDKLQRQAGLELLTELAEKRGNRAAREKLLAYVAEAPAEEAEESLIARLASVERPDTGTVENAFGLVDPSQITFAPKPAKTGVPLITTSALRVLVSLDALFHEHRDRELKVPKSWFSEDENAPFEIKTLADLPAWFARPREDADYATDKARYPLADLNETWLAAHPDTDVHDIFRASVLVELLSEAPYGQDSKLQKDIRRQHHGKLRYPNVLTMALAWMLHQKRQELQPRVILDIFADVIATLADDDYRWQSSGWWPREVSWRADPVIDLLTRAIEALKGRTRPEDDGRAFELLRYIDEPKGAAGRPDVFLELSQQIGRGIEVTWPPKQEDRKLKTPPRKPCPLELVDRALQAGGCTKADVFDLMSFYDSGSRCIMLQVATRQRSKFSDALLRLVDEYVARIVEVESTRGELPTDATWIVPSIRSGVYLPQVRKLLASNVALSARLDRATSRAAVFHHLLAVSRPSQKETPDVVAQSLSANNIKPDRLLELAMLAPQWADGVEKVIGWEGLSDAVWWVHAHTKDEQWGIETSIRELWAGEISERSPLSGEELLQGAVDVAWFNRFRPKFDAKQWKRIEEVAKFASQSAGHTRARLFAQAMTGAVSADDLMKRIEEKRTPDAVRALGLVPLPTDAEQEIRRRYQVMQDFLAGSRKFGSMRQATEKGAVRIGLDNLARTAGYPDPLRLTWALEAKEAEDLRGSGKSVTAGEVAVRLFFDMLGEPSIEATKNGAALKDIPSAAKKVPEIKELVDRRTRLRKQAQRMRQALEQAMQRGDWFEADEVRKLIEHPGLAPILRNLLFLGESQAGFLNSEGLLEGEPGRLRLAHPYDLLQRGDWPEWQSAVFREERIQPFKQVFRELYALTDTEKEAGESTRYAGHQLNPRQALAILGKRGWVIRAEEGVTKTLHEIGLTAHLSFDEVFFTPADIEGLTLSHLTFARSGSAEPVRLSEVPPISFSETMRDLDLIVSVASMVGIDPEASESTVEMRASVVREMAALLRLQNLEVTGRHVIVRGALGEYTVHLGSGVVHQRARGELVIIPVRQPQRGRLFLPFLDDDPRTAEIASKVLLLARDKEIKDPTILSQIVRI